MISTDQHYKLAIAACSGATLRPVSFTGHEQVMEPFWFALDVVQPAAQPTLDLAKAIGSQASFSICAANAARAEIWLPIHGIVGQISHVGTGDDWHHYQVLIVPKLKLLSLVRHSRVFRDQKLQDIVDKVLLEAEVPAAKWALSGAAAKLGPRPYVVQHDETDLEFISRLCARFGVWYFFAFEKGSTDLLFTDVGTSFPLVEGNIPYQPEASTGGRPAADWHRQEVIKEFSETRTLVPFKVAVRGWKSDQPQDAPEGEHQNKDIANSAFNEYLFGSQAPERSGPGTADVYAGQPDCTQLARQAVEEHAVRHRLCTGGGEVRSLRAGMVLGMTQRVAAKPDQWVVLSVNHEGAQGAGRGAGSDGKLFYRNQFTAIPKNDKLPYRPAERPWPKIPGFLTAQVESSGGSGDPYANLDDQGRYHVRLAADRENKGDAKASLPVRMMSPSTGQEWGFHLPLHHGAEVMLAHVDGDPDRPVIAGAVPNITTPQVVTLDNQTQSRWKTAGNNELVFEDKKDSELVYLHAQKDRETVVENDESRKIVNNQSQWVGNGQFLAVGLPVPDIGSPSAPNPLQGMVDQRHQAAPSPGKFGQLEFVLIGSAKVVGGFYQIAVGGAMNTTVGLAKTEQVGAFHHSTVLGYRKIEVGKDFSVSVKGEHSEIAEKDRKIETKKKLLIEAADEIVIKVGKSKITMKKDGVIAIEGKSLDVKTTGDTVIKAKNILQNP